MALVRDLFSRQLSISARETYLQAILKDLRCHQEDEVFFHGGITGMPVPPFACQFAPDALHGNLLAVADEEGSLRLMNTQHAASQSLVKEVPAHSNAIFDISWLPGGEQLVQQMTASGDTSVVHWDVVSGKSIATYKYHTGSVKTVDVKYDEPSVFVSGGRDGNIFIWDTRCLCRGSKQKPVNHIRLAHKKTSMSPPVCKKRKSSQSSNNTTPKNVSDSQHGVTSVLFHGNNKLASCGAVDGVVKLWDLRRTYTISKVVPPVAWHSFAPTGDPERPFGFTSLVSDPWQSSLFASCTNDIIYMYSTSLLASNPMGAFSGHRNSTFYVKAAISSEGRYLLSGSSCGRAFIWEVDKPDQAPLVLVGHQREVTAVCWSPTLMDKVVTCSDNNDLRVWRVTRHKGVPDHHYVGSAVPYDGEGHKKAKEAMIKHSVRETPLSFRKKRASSTSDENRQALKLTPTITPQSSRVRTSSISGSRGIKRKATGAATTPHRVLQLHNYFTKTDDE